MQKTREYTLEEATYKYQKEVPIYLCDINNRLKLSGILKYIQEAGTTQFNNWGFSYERLYEEGIISLLSKISVKFHRMPSADEIVSVKTNPQRTKGASFLRRIEFYSEAGELLVEAQTAWLMVSTETRKILRPSQFPHEIPAYAENYNEILAEYKVKPYGNIIKTEDRATRFTDLDCNNHINNTVYADIIMDFLPIEVATKMEVKQLVTNYRSEVVYGDTLTLTLEQNPENLNEYYIVGKKQAETCFEAMIEF